MMRRPGTDWRAYDGVAIRATFLVEGEVSTFHFRGCFSHAVVKRPKRGGSRVREAHGGLIEPCTPDTGIRHASDGVLAVPGEPPLQARVDLVHLGTVRSR
jgi:hypothetical protein